MSFRKYEGYRGNGRIQLSIQDSPLISTILRQAGLSVSSEDQPRVTEQPHLAQDDLVQLNIVMHVVGSRGDVQPFLSVAKTLQSHRHRVRLATHPCFQDFVESNGVEFFSIGGDPAKLMAFMVQNPGLIPDVRSVARGEVNERQKEMHKMLIGCWRSCIEPGNGLGPSISEGHDRVGHVEGKPFLADFIIANPPSSAHIHCAEKLGIPLHILFTSPSLIPKPRDWEDHISISGFCFLSQTDDYTPDPALTAFLRAGPPPIYIGFGSIVVDDPDGLTEILLAAIKKTGVRALISKGWGGLGKESVPLPEDVYILGNVPHDWLFQHVSSVVHHGGAGTTAIGMACGKPTVIVPFFGDQPFWGAMIARAGAGPSPIPFKKLTEDTLAEAITTALEPSSVVAAKKLAASIASENGSETAVDAFHQALNVDHLRCDLAPGHIAVWQLKKRNNIKLSSLAAQVLSQEGLLSLNDLKL
ncbi:hypothetical protein N0V94_005217 [Neodidymelliopsis sp. IMI 364377]|nr:hypothetical protein N0V94_005217 [Neodidymelliopsis sp. IMI 364377]